jgi:Holliday junction resolvasome RuvABC endonuclease subunit
MVIGIDPATSTSNTSVAVIEKNEKDQITIKGIYSIAPCNFIEKSNNLKILTNAIYIIVKNFSGAKIICEEPYLQGSANKLLLRFFGVLEDKITIDEYVAPLSVKKSISGNGKSEKDELAKSLLQYDFDRKSKNLINKLIKNQSFDETDAVAIALFGLNFTTI